ncbi:fibronectin type III domain-containing protein [bacterium]|nr:fibronectin type III domain-containing protein [bacterium]
MRPSSTILTLALAALIFHVTPSVAAEIKMTGLACTDLSITSARVSWLTDAQTLDNRVEVREKGSDSLLVFTDEYASETYTHLIALIGLKVGTEYEYRLRSDSTLWDNSDRWYSFKTFLETVGGGTPWTAHGSLFDGQGEPLDRCLVRLQVRRANGDRSVVKTVLNKRGGTGEVAGQWDVDMTTVREELTGYAFNPGAGDRLFIEYFPNYWTNDTDSSVVLQGSASFFIPAHTVQVYDPNLGMRGDLDNNGKVNVFDLLDILKVLGGSKPVAGDQRLAFAADVDGNGRYDVFDLLALLRLMSGSAA